LRIVRLDIERFRSIRSTRLLPGVHNVYLGPNNIGKTCILEALNLLLNPEMASRSAAVDENDFYRREYRFSTRDTTPSRENTDLDSSESTEASQCISSKDARNGEAQSPKETNQSGATGRHANPGVPDANGVEATHVEPSEDETTGSAPVIHIEAVIAGLTDDDIREFSSVLVPWDAEKRRVIEHTKEGEDPFARAEPAVRPCFEAWYDEEEDDFAWRSFFRTDPQLSRDESPAFTRRHKRRIGFLIYRDFRALQRPITLQSSTLFARLLQSQDATPKLFEDVLAELKGAALPLLKEPQFARVVNEYRDELIRYLPLANIGEGRLSFEVTDRTRGELKSVTQLYVDDEVPLPLQKMGAGTRSLALLAMLLLIARKRGRGIMALEEPETFLFPHAQRRVIDEILALATQTFVTTHSPYVLERMPVESFQRLLRDETASVTATPVVRDTRSARQMRDRFRKQLSEALLGRGAIVVEEESTRLWILRASALLHGQEFVGTKVEALELQGIAVVTAENNGDVPGVSALLRRAGLEVVGFLDQVADKELEQYISKVPDVPLVFHRERGLEDLLVRELPRPLLRKVLTSAPYAKHKYDAATVDGWTAEEFKKKAREFLRQHKGYLPVHEWILDQVDLNAVPITFKCLVTLTVAASSGRYTWSTCSLLPLIAVDYREQL